MATEPAVLSKAALPSQRLAGKTILFTGAGGAIGLETSIRLLQQGANLSLIDINAEALETTASKLRSHVPAEASDQRLLTITADVTSEAESSTRIFDTTEESYEKIMRVNVKSGIRHTAKAMKDPRSGRSIVLTSSIAGLRGTPGLILYSVSKFALRGLALTAASELGEFGIRVNTIHPSGVNTPMFKASWSPEQMEKLKAAAPLGRFAETSDIDGVVSFLASDDSQFMTGGFLKIDGGSMSF
ncbi:putative short-chain dehydrogenase [Thelonectria olida]|uniref:Short-chain dehydrogenase n=1 Tax=Thelonectria olida TaxID=1576542 RepID=A0A9P8VPY6_9HYPO|nr:putative short-chain dehydrogenase [Thelonectria olida]